MRWFKKKNHNPIDMLWVMYIANREVRANEQTRKWA